MKLVHVMLAAIFLTAAQTAFAQPSHEIVVTDEDMGKTLNLGPDDILVVRLRANPTTGSSWFTVLAPGSLIALVGHSYTPDPHPPGWVGGGGVEEFRFKPTAAVVGRSYQLSEWFKMLEMRPFERGISGAKLWEIQIVE